MMEPRAAIYTRISKDEDLERLGVKRQEKDLRAEAKRRGATVSLLLEDNDLSGSGKVRRPAYEQLMDAITGGDVDLVLAHDLDRLNRGLTDYVRLYTACEKARITVAWLGGEANFATGTGIFEMEMRATFAREELRKIRSRTKRKHLELAENGHDAGGGRPFGYAADRHTLNNAEADLIREAVGRALQGEPLRSICSDWQHRGVPTAKGARWSSRVMHRMLASARISGRRELCTVDGVRSDQGEIMNKGEADWPAIITVEESDRIRALLSAPERHKEGHARKYLLTGGLLRCGHCDKPLHTMTARKGKKATKTSAARGPQRRGYACISGPGFSGGCGHLRINAEPVEKLIVDRILAAVDQGGLRRALKGRQKGDDSGRELAAVEAKLAELAVEWSSRRITRGEWQAARTSLAARLEVLQQRVESQRRKLSLDGIEDAPLRYRWPTLPLHRQRAVIQMLVQAIKVKPAKGRGPVFDPDRVSVTWKA